MTFLNNVGLLAELEGSTEICRKEGKSLVEEFVFRMVLKCKTHKIQDMVDEFIRWIHPNELTSRGIRTEALLTGGSKHDGNVAVALMPRRQEPEIFFPNSITFAVTFNKTADTVLNLACCHEICFHGITHHVGNL